MDVMSDDYDKRSKRLTDKFSFSKYSKGMREEISFKLGYT